MVADSPLAFLAAVTADKTAAAWEVAVDGGEGEDEEAAAAAALARQLAADCKLPPAVAERARFRRACVELNCSIMEGKGDCCCCCGFEFSLLEGDCWVLLGGDEPRPGWCECGKAAADSMEDGFRPGRLNGDGNPRKDVARWGGRPAAPAAAAAASFRLWSARGSTAEAVLTDGLRREKRIRKCLYCNMFPDLLVVVVFGSQTPHEIAVAFDSSRRSSGSARWHSAAASVQAHVLLVGDGVAVSCSQTAHRRLRGRPAVS